MRKIVAILIPQNWFQIAPNGALIIKMCDAYQGEKGTVTYLFKIGF